MSASGSTPSPGSGEPCFDGLSTWENYVMFGGQVFSLHSSFEMTVTVDRFEM